MKRIVVILLALLLGTTMLTGLAGCGGNSAPSGRYTLVSLEMDGYDVVEVYTALGMDTSDMYLEFTGDKNYKLVMLDETQTGVYELNGNRITVGEITGTIEGNKITFEETGNPATDGYSTLKMVFEKK